MHVTDFVMTTTQSAFEQQPLALSAEMGPEPAPPSDAPVQEIIFEPRPGPAEPQDDSLPEDAVILRFVMADPQIAIRMQQAVRASYALYGESGLHQLKAALFGDYYRTWTLQGEPTYHGPQRGRLIEQYWVELAGLEGIAASVRTSVVKAAVMVARQRLCTSERVVMQETKRYLGLSANDNQTAAAALDSRTLALPLSGPDLIPLATALLRIDAARKPVLLAEDEAYRIGQPVFEQRRAHMTAAFENLTEENFLDTGTIARVAEVAIRQYPETDQMRTAHEIVAQEQAELAAFIAAEAVVFPILYRLWSFSLADRIRQALRGFRSTNYRQDQRALSASVELRGAILTTLRRTREAVQRTRERLKSGDLNVWHYPPLVTEAMRRLVIPPGTVEWQAATLRMNAEEASLAASLSSAAMILEVAAPLIGVAPPVAVAAVLINYLLGAWELITELARKIEEQDAFDSSLDPAKSFAAEPSYAGLLVQIGFLLLNARDVRTGFRKAARVR